MRVKLNCWITGLTGIFLCLCTLAPAAPPTWTISGTVQTTAGTPAEGVTVTVTGDNGATSTLTAPDGTYAVTVPNHWSGTVSVSKSGWLITPPSKTYTNVSADIPNQTYTAYQPKITGTVTKSDDAPIQGVSLTANNAGGSDTTDSSGYYEINVPYGWSGMVIANKFKWEMVPESYSYAIVNSDQVAQNFTATYVGIVVKPDGTGDYPTIQEAIDASVNGDKIIVSPGRYYENINFYGKNIILQSTNPQDTNVVDTTIIDADGNGSVVAFSGSETEVCKLAGFTITGGSTSYGGGVYGGNSKATIENCIITDNIVNYNGGGLINCDGMVRNCVIVNNHVNVTGGYGGYGGGLTDCDGIIQNCTIENNTARYGGGMYRCNGTIINSIISGNTADFYGGGLHDCDGTIEECTISENIVDGYAGNGNDADGCGGGLSNCDGMIRNCTIVNNYADSTYPDQGFGGGLYNCDGMIEECTIAENTIGGEDGGGLYDCDGTIQNCIIWANHAYGDVSLYQVSSCATPIYTCIQDWTGGGTGNISNDPLFVDALNNDYHLTFNSPCVNAGNPSTVYDPEATDSDGDPRFVGNIDMGVDEVYIEGSAGLSVNPTSIEFVVEGIDSDIPIQTLDIFNCGTSDLSWTIINDCDWLNISSASGLTESAQTSEIAVGVNNDYINHGIQTCQFQINAPNAANNPVLVQVYLRVFHEPGRRYVPEEYPTIQSAVDAVDPGYEIIVAPGRYYERIRFRGKDITLRSENPEDPNVVAATIIDANNVGTVVYFDGPETPDCVFSGFTVTGGYGIYVGGIRGYTNATIRNCTIVDNVSYYYTYAGGIYQCHGLIENCTIDNNSTWGVRDCDGTIRNCMITNNYLGGMEECDGIIEGCHISNNFGNGLGGGLRECNGEIRDCIISDNTAHSGGGLYECDAEILRCKIVNNHANYSGGGGLAFCRGRIFGCEIVNNSAVGDGGGLYRCNDTFLINCIITNNSAGGYGGGLSRCNGDVFYGYVIQNCTIVGNESILAGGGIHEGQEMTRNCIIWGNTSASNEQLYNSPVPSYSCIQDWTGGGFGNFSDSPLFVNEVSGDYHISMNSPCINKGGYYSSYNVDIDGDPRFIGNIDIGADEVYVGDSAGLSISRNEIDFIAMGMNDNMAPQTSDVFNCGTQDLNWSVIKDCDWLIISPVTGQTGSTLTDAIVISVDNDYVRYGLQTCQFEINAPDAVNSPQVVTVTLEVLRPEIGVSPASIELECDLNDPTSFNWVMTVSNSGYDTLNWQIAEDCDWLSVSPTAGQCSTEPNVVTLTVNPAGLDIGFYEGQLTITDENAANSPVTVPVSLHIYRDGERHVPTEYPSIQQAINAAVDGDHVIIHPGRYTDYYDGDINFCGKQITVRSIDPTDPEIVAGTIISNESFYSVFVFSEDDYSDAVIDGLTIADIYRFGTTPGYGIAITCKNTNGPRIRNCIFHNLSGDTIIYGSNSTMTFENCSFTQNELYGNVIMSGSSASSGENKLYLRNCLIAENIFPERDQYPVYRYYHCLYTYNVPIQLNNCTIAYNRTWSDLGYDWTSFPGILSFNGSITINNSIIWGNSTNYENDDNRQIVITTAPQSPVLNGPWISVSNSDIQYGKDQVLLLPDFDSFYAYGETRQLPDPNLIDPNWIEWGLGNIDLDPLFVAEPDDGGDGWNDDNETPEVNESTNNIYGDYHLKSQAGRFVWDGFARADFNFDTQVNLLDFSRLSQDWQMSIPPYYHWYPWNYCDLNKDGYIGLEDVALFGDDYLQPRVFGAWVTDVVTSPCIDAGDPNDPAWQNEPWPHGERINMGAYGGTTQASLSPIPAGNSPDLNDDAIDPADWPLWVDDPEMNIVER